MTEIFESLRDAAYGPTIDGLLSALGALEATHCVDRMQWDYVMSHLHARKAMDHDSLIRACNTYQIVRDPEEAVRGYGTAYTDAHIRRAVARVLLTPQMLRTYAELHRTVAYDKTVLWPTAPQVHDAMLLATEMALLPKHLPIGAESLGEPGKRGITRPGVTASCACRGATSAERKTIWVNAIMEVVFTPWDKTDDSMAGRVFIGEGPIQDATITLVLGFSKGAAPHADLDVRWTDKRSGVTWVSGPTSFGYRATGKPHLSEERGELPKVRNPPYPSKAHRSLWAAARSVPCGPSKLVRGVDEIRIPTSRTVTKSTKLHTPYPVGYRVGDVSSTTPHRTPQTLPTIRTLSDIADALTYTIPHGDTDGRTTGS